MAALYSLYSDEIARQGTITLEVGTAVDTYGVDRLTDDNPAHLFKTNDTTVVIEIDHGAPTPLGLVALIHATTEAGDDVVIQGGDGSDWYAPEFEAPFPQSGWLGSGTARWPINSKINDVSALEGYDPAGYAKHRLVFGRDTALAQALQIGQLRMHPPPTRRMYLDRHFPEKPVKPRYSNPTVYGVQNRRSLRTTLWKAELRLPNLFDSENERADFQTLWYDVDGGNRPWLFVPDEDEAPVYLVLFSSDEQQLERFVKGVTNVTGAVEEAARGLRPGT